MKCIFTKQTLLLCLLAVAVIIMILNTVIPSALNIIRTTTNNKCLLRTRIKTITNRTEDYKQNILDMMQVQKHLNAEQLVLVEEKMNW